MDNTITINNQKENTIEFDLSIKGLPSKEIEACLVIEAKKMCISFEAKHDKGDKWIVDIPELPMIERTAYNYYIAVIADGYYFKPISGTVNVVGSHEVYASAPKNTSLKTTNQEAEKKEKEKEEKKKEERAEEKKKIKENITPPPQKGRERSIEDIARDLLSQASPSPTNSIVDKTVDKLNEWDVDVKTLNDRKIHEILESVGIKVHKRKKFSLKS
jgi:hypothetical protein